MQTAQSSTIHWTTGQGHCRCGNPTPNILAQRNLSERSITGSGHIRVHGWGIRTGMIYVVFGTQIVTMETVETAIQRRQLFGKES